MKTRLLLLLLFAFTIVNAQNATFSNGFESESLPSGWDSYGVTRITTQSCSGTASMTASTGQYSAVTIATPRYLSDGQEIRLSTKYSLNYEGIIYLQYSINDQDWINVVVTNAAGSCKTLSGIIATNVVPAGTYVRFRIQTYNPLILTNVTYIFDDFTAVQSNGTLAEYDFNNTLADKLGANSFSSGNHVSFVDGRDGSTNGAVNLNNFGTTATIPGLPYSNDARTISVWAKTNVFNSLINYIFHYGNTANGNGLALRPSTILYFASSAANLETSFTNPNDTWVHYVCTYDGTTAKVYRNGTLFSSGAKTYNTVSNSDIFRLGLTESGIGTYFNGAIDDLKIFNIALTADQVQNLFSNNSAFVVTSPIVTNVSASNITTVASTINYAVNANNATTTTTIKYGLSSNSLTNHVAGLIASGNNLIPTSTLIPNLEPNTQYFYQIEVTNSAGTVQSDPILNFTTLNVPEPTLIAEYDFNNTLADKLGANPFSSGSQTSFVDGRDGSSNGAVNLNNNGAIATIPGLPYSNDPRTISVWAKTNVFNPNINYIFHYGNTANGNGLALRPSSILYFANANANLETSFTNPNDTWVHYVCTYDGTTAKVYRNGTLFSSGAKTFNTVSNSDIFRLGLTEGGAINYFNGAIDDLKIYHYELTQAQINSLYTTNQLSTSTKILKFNNTSYGIYPNPTTDVLNFENNNEVVLKEIMDLQGKRLLSTNQNSINVSGLNSGIYIVKFTQSDNQIGYGKFVKN